MNPEPRFYTPRQSHHGGAARKTPWHCRHAPAAAPSQAGKAIIGVTARGQDTGPVRAHLQSGGRAPPPIDLESPWFHPPASRPENPPMQSCGSSPMLYLDHGCPKQRTPHAPGARAVDPARAGAPQRKRPPGPGALARSFPTPHGIWAGSSTPLTHLTSAQAPVRTCVCLYLYALRMISPGSRPYTTPPSKREVASTGHTDHHDRPRVQATGENTLRRVTALGYSTGLRGVPDRKSVV